MRRKRFPGSIDRRGDTYRIRLSVGGMMHSYTLPAALPDGQDARRAAELFARTEDKKLREQLRAGRLAAALEQPVGTRFSALLTMFREQAMPTLAAGTQNAYGDSLGPIESYFITELKDPLIDAIAAKHVTEFLTWRRVHRLDGASPLSNQTLIRDRAVLHRVFAFADQLELRQGNPVARVDAPKADEFNPIILDAPQYERLVEACSDRPMLRTYVLLLGEAGLRCESEALWLRWEQIDFDGGFLQVQSGREHRTKSGKSRWVPLTPRLATALRGHVLRFKAATYAGGKTSPWLFHHEFTRRQHKAGERIISMRHAFGNAATRAKLPDELRQHDLRHRRVTTWLAEGKNPVHVKEAMGHSSIAVTMRYTHLSREHLKSLVDAPAPIAGSGEKSQASGA